MAKILQLRIELDGIKPPIWRTILIEDSSSFQELHETIQKAVGWEDYHLYEFSVKGEKIAPEEEGHNLAEGAFKKLSSSPETLKMIKQQILSKASQALNIDKLNQFLNEAEKSESAGRFNINAALGELIKSKGQQFTYIYDFGDSWKNTITVENITEEDKSQTYPACVAGARAGSPEDCGGVYGYNELMKIRKNKTHPEYKERIVEWLGEDYDPEHFEIDEANRALSLPSDTDVENAATAFTDEFFPKMWKEEKDDLKDLSKKEIAEEMYYRGIVEFILENKKHLPGSSEYDKDDKR